MGRHRTAGAGSGSSRTPLIHPAPFRAPQILLVVIGRRSASAPASPSRGPGNGILRAETGGLFQAQNAGEQSEFGSQTTLRLTNPPELRGFLSTRKPPRFVGTAWWWTQSRETGLQRLTPNSTVNVFFGGPNGEFLRFSQRSNTSVYNVLADHEPKKGGQQENSRNSRKQ